MLSDMTRIPDIVSPWLPPPGVLRLNNDEVHVWRASLRLTSAQVNSLQTFLSADELVRTERFHFQKNRDDFMAGRGILRVILAGYNDIAPGDLRFISGPHGKPLLDNSFHGTNLSFNLSHSQSVALYAITKTKQVGVDIEYLNRALQCREIVSRFFSVRERELWYSVPMERAHEVFYSCWTRKEALLKAMGVGLLIEPKDIDTIRQSGELIRMLKPEPGSEVFQHWSIVDLDPGCDYMAALVVEGEGGLVKYWQFPEY